jgi:FkbM family methyltransferase
MSDWQSAQHIFIYGTGTFARDVLDTLTRHNLDVSGFLDHTPRQPVVRELAVTTPEAIALEMRASAAVILGIHNRDARVATIVSRLEALGYAHLVTPVDLYDHFAADLGTRYWLTQRTFYGAYAQEIEATARLLADSTSRALFEAILRFRASGDYSRLPAPDLERQYFPADLPAWKSPLRLMDCGAYDGDTLRNILTFGIPLAAVAAYEPDETNFRKLAETARVNHIPNAMLWPCGVYSSTTQLHFATGQGEASLISGSGEAVIQCVSLDESAPNFAPTFIKMDIEGAELEALRGAEKTIAAFHPGLALSVYHTPAHLWEIPLWVAQFAREHGLAYSYFLRAHGQNCFDTVFYALPA